MLRDEWCPGRSWDVRESRWPPGSQSFQSVHLWCSDGGCLQILHVKIRRSLPVHVLLARSVEFVGWCPQIPGLQPLQAPYCLPSQAFHPPFHRIRSEEHTSELQSRGHLVCRLLLEKNKQAKKRVYNIV